MTENSQHDRRLPSHGVVLVEGQPTIIFGTVCTKSRTRWLAADDVHLTLREVWSTANAWLVGRYVIMPDHVHFFAVWTGAQIEFDHWVKYWKSQFSKSFGRPQCRWLTDHWDTRMRTVAIYEEKWIYVQNNPVRHGLVACSEDWPYQGAIHALPWD